MEEKEALEFAAKKLECEIGDILAYGWRGESFVVIGPTGQKFVFDPQKLKAAKPQAAPEEPVKELPAPAAQANARPGATSRPKRGARSASRNTSDVKRSATSKKTSISAPPESKSA